MDYNRVVFGGYRILDKIEIDSDSDVKRIVSELGYDVGSDGIEKW